MRDIVPLRHPRHGERLLVEVIKGSNETKSGLVLAGNNRERPLGGRIRAVAPDSQFHVEQLVYFSKYAGTRMKLDEIDCCLLYEEDILFTSRDVHVATAASR